MGLIFDSIITDLIVALFTIIFVIYAFFKYRYTYWARRKVEYLEPSFPFGNVSDFIRKKKSLGVVFLDIYNNFKCKKLPFGGFYSLGNVSFMACDPDLIKLITTKDFQYFHDRDHYINEEIDPLTVHLLALNGTKWRNLRHKLTPTFTSGKMKMMFNLFLQCCDHLNKVVDQQVIKTEPIDIKDVLARFTTDVIGTCAFGIDCNSLANPDAEFRKYGKKIFEGFFRMFCINMLAATHKGLVTLFNIRLFGADVSNFFLNLVNEIVEYREKNNVVRNDVMNLLIKLRNNENVADEDDEDKLEKDKVSPGEGLTVAQIAAQAFIFFFAGFETSSSTMTFCLFEVAENQDIQDKLRKDILETLKNHNNELTYDAVMEMSYLDKVIKETLRKYPVAPAMMRKCGKDYKIPNTDVVIEKDTNIVVPILGLHRDPDYYPDPMKFDPERFNEELKATRHQYTYLPFGEGPRTCIGKRFGLLQAKAGVASLLRNYKFTLDSKTKTPLELDNKSVLLSSKTTIWLQGTKI